MATHPDVINADVIDYFARVLRRGQLDEVTFGDDKFVAVRRSQLEAGNLPEEQVEKLFAQHKGNTPLPVVISLLSLQLPQGKHAGLVLLAANLSRDGQLEPVVETASSPWIPSERLNSAQVAGREVMLGDQDAFWASFHGTLSADLSQVESFTDALELADALTNEVTGLTPAQFAAQRTDSRTVLEADLCYVTVFERINATRSLLELYDFMGRTNELGLASQLVPGVETRRHESSVHAGNGLLMRALDSCGSMGDEHPLTPSQRRAVHGFLSDGNGDITAVSGPPGTGKTTMLQSVVATMLTRRALQEEPPPLIVGMSTNNQAVTNIIDAFAKVTKQHPGPLDHRWLPEVVDGSAGDKPMSSLAVYCPSGAKRSSAAEKYLVEDHRRSGVYSEYSAKEYLDGARDRYVSKAFDYFGSASDVPGLKSLLHETLSEVENLRCRLLTTMATEGPGRDYTQLCAQAANSPYLSGLNHVTALADCADLEALDKELDRTLRYAEFWLAVHYYEAWWLEAEFLSPDDRWKNTAPVMDTYWGQAPALTPCFVMTTYQVPKYFSLWAKEGESRPFDIGRIDLLIVDEAGQVDTPVGLPPFALAKRALVVGDTKQLSPVWSIDEQTDADVAASAGIHPDGWKRLLRPRGLTCSQPSSLMAAAAHASRWVYGDEELEPGLFLAEHFRCHPRIIGLCNDLLYGGLLKPQRKASGSPLHGLTEAFQFREVPGSADTREGTSRKNVPEADAIADWIVDNFDILHEWYIDRVEDPNKQAVPEEIIGVVTPFSAQARAVRKALRERLRNLPADSRIPAGLASQITIGTAHRLQGAERPVILFSAVYGDSEGQAGFIDANPELLNVAVSRAKDLLVMFGSARRWNNGRAFTVVADHATRTALDIGEEPEPPSEPQPRTIPAREAVRQGPAQETTAGATTGAAAVASGATRITFHATPSKETSAEPTPSEVAPASASTSEPDPAVALTLSQLISQWAEAGELRAEDAALRAAAMNLRLRDAGILEGEPGAWNITAAGELAGVVAEQRSKRDGTTYDVILYGPQAQEGLLRLYRAGRL